MSRTTSARRLHDDSDDEYSTLSFGALNAAQEKLKHQQDQSDSESESESDSDSDAPPRQSSSKKRFTKTPKKNKHAPTESSSKRPVSRIRDIPGLETKSTLHTDIRFDPAYGKADLAKTRKDYAFLDEYRHKEVESMQAILKDKKSQRLLSNHERDDIQLRLQSLKSRLDTMKNRDLEAKILADHKRLQLKGFKDGNQSKPYFLKKSEQRKLIQKAKFEGMKASQREKVMERKRKRRLGKEFRQLEFRGN
ncbi:DUF947-domain-containing protein [Suhomyces tanzawaensis NRRL Y-17324]|uniref:rRNA biogenesis protein RRP36 n=1 Tax=Suhomyces tanzawaensis NRRL Y-17324 TaxID=984487 RepID=A0A1E4SKS1_9ASCO|nr:DUF947-domain-containing protein [Suhomyces tanzawaensis NRRL Y-17324]ODV80098.1 DUF947-domain-containing protein [Suhomyces tanzawaensis NRRL Y-17324]